MCENNSPQKQPLPEDLVHPVTKNTTNATALPDYEAQGLGRYDVAPDNEIPDLPENQTAGIEHDAKRQDPTARKRDDMWWYPEGED